MTTLKGLGTNTNLYAFINSGSGLSENSNYSIISDSGAITHTPAIIDGNVVDLNGDGLNDVMVRWTHPSGPGAGSAVDLYGFINTGTGFVANKDYNIPSALISGTPSAMEGNVVDLNGDGLNDVMIRWTHTAGPGAGSAVDFYGFINSGDNP